MRYFFNLLVSFFVLTNIAGCKKSGPNSLEGTWRWTGSSGGLITHSVSPSPNAIVTLRLFGDMTYKLFLNGQIKTTGKYRFTSNGNFQVIQFDTRLNTDMLSLEIEEMIEKIENGKLQVYDNNFGDGFTHYFTK
jgi:hypothetical protein